MNSDSIVSSHLTRSMARASKKAGQKVVKAGTFASGSFGLYSPRHGYGDLITVWHVVQNPPKTNK